jgi:hypothetical protein
MYLTRRLAHKLTDWQPIRWIVIKEIQSQGELERYVCGGYFIVKTANNSGPVDFCEICKAKLPPGEIVTLSTCLTVMLPHHWAHEWVNVTDEERRRRPQIWGLRDSDLNHFIKWTTERQQAGEIGYPNALRTLDNVRFWTHRRSADIQYRRSSRWRSL